MRISKYPLFIVFLGLITSSCSTSRKTTYVSPAMDELAKSYIDKYSNMAVSEMKRTGIPASITLAQGILESDFGRSTLARKANNHFGIKCHNGWTGDKIYHDDDKKSECFRRYDNAADSYRDHSDFLVNTSRYKSLFSLSSTDYKGWAHGLKRCGYATNPSYATLLIDNIEKYDLHSFDTGVKRRVSASNNGSGHSASLAGSSRPATSSSSQSYSSGNGGVVIGAGEARIQENNRVQYIIVRDGDTFESLAEEFQLLRWEIVKYNELKEGATLYAGQIIYLQPKRSKADVRYSTHVVKEGETMYVISQKYAIKTEALYKLNFMDEGSEPAAGKSLRLR